MHQEFHQSLAEEGERFQYNNLVAYSGVGCWFVQKIGHPQFPCLIILFCIEIATNWEKSCCAAPGRGQRGKKEAAKAGDTLEIRYLASMMS